MFILDTYDLTFEGKTRKHMLLPALALACARRDRLQALAASVAVAAKVTLDVDWLPDQE